MDSSALDWKASDLWDFLAKQKKKWMTSGEEQIRKAPFISVILAIAAGTFLPIGWMIRKLLGIAFKLIKPLLLVAGLCKLWKIIQASPSSERQTGTTTEPLLDSPPGPPAHHS